jgi:hypothetical protein
MSFSASGYADGGSYRFHFPDGNASIARLLVRALIPDAIPGHNAEDVVTAQVDYGRLDTGGAPIRMGPRSYELRLGRHIQAELVAFGIKVLGRPEGGLRRRVSYTSLCFFGQRSDTIPLPGTPIFATAVECECLQSVVSDCTA